MQGGGGIRGPRKKFRQSSAFGACFRAEDARRRSCALWTWVHAGLASQQRRHKPLHGHLCLCHRRHLLSHPHDCDKLGSVRRHPSLVVNGHHPECFEVGVGAGEAAETECVPPMIHSLAMSRCQKHAKKDCIAPSAVHIARFLPNWEAGGEA